MRSSQVHSPTRQLVKKTRQICENPADWQQHYNKLFWLLKSFWCKGGKMSSWGPSSEHMEQFSQASNYLYSSKMIKNLKDSTQRLLNALILQQH